MKKSQIINEIRKLNVPERLNILIDLWNEIKESKEPEPIADDEKRVLINRLANYQSDPDSAIDWQVLKDEVTNKYDILC